MLNCIGLYYNHDIRFTQLLLYRSVHSSNSFSMLPVSILMIYLHSENLNLEHPSWMSLEVPA